jgi:hypothetical protein
VVPGSVKHINEVSDNLEQFFHRVSETETLSEGSCGNCLPNTVTETFPYDVPVLGFIDNTSGTEKFRRIGEEQL